LIWWDWVGRNTDSILAALREHVVITVVAVLAGLVISAPLAYLAHRWPRTATPILAVTGALYTIPAVAMIFLLGPFTGFLAIETLYLALVIYSLLILIRNILTGLQGVPAEVREAARGMGYTPARMLFTVELPLALPSIVAGLRIATVSTIGLVTIGALITYGGLGELIYDGLNRDFTTPTMVGSLLCVALALVADAVLLGTQRLLTPWSRVRRSA